MTAYVIPLQTGTAQTLRTNIAGKLYYLRLVYNDVLSGEGGWTLDIANSQGTILLGGVPLVTGVDLLAQYAYLGVGAKLYVFTPGDITSPPTYAGLGGASKLLWEYA